MDWGLGPSCLASSGLTDADRLPQRTPDGRFSQPVLQLLYGVVGYPRHVVRYDGSSGWVNVVTGELVVVSSPPRPRRHERRSRGDEVEREPEPAEARSDP
jgi:hypothetical protein